MLRIAATPLRLPERCPAGGDYSLACLALAVGYVEQVVPTNVDGSQGPYTFSSWLKSRTGTREITLEMRGAAGERKRKTVEISENWGHYDLTARAFPLTELAVVIGDGSAPSRATDEVLVSAPQLERSLYPTSGTPRGTPRTTAFASFTDIREAAEFAALSDDLLGLPMRGGTLTALSGTPILKHPRMKMYACPIHPRVADTEFYDDLAPTLCLPDESWTGTMPVPLSVARLERQDWEEYVKAYDIVQGLDLQAQVEEIQRDLDDLAQQLVSSADARFELDSRRFEALIAHLFTRGGYSVELTKRTRDGGLDIHCVTSKRGRFLVGVECKRNAAHRKVGVDVVRSLVGTLVLDGHSSGVLATTSGFSPYSYDIVGRARAKGLDISLVDFDEIRRWILAIQPGSTSRWPL